MPKVSVIIPVYKVEKVLHYCIESVLRQTYTDFNLILVDDGSPDNSGKICDEYALKDSRIKVIHKENRGVSSARNLGIKEATGDYICFVDSDDYLEEDYLKDLLNTKGKYNDCDNIWCGFRIVESYDRKIRSLVVDSKEIYISCYDKNKIMTLHEKWLDASPCNKLYSRKIIVNNNLLMDESLSLGEDLIFNLQYLDCSDGKIVIINRPLYNYTRTGAESLDNKYYPNLFEIYKKINDKLLFYAVRWKLSQDQKGKAYSSSFYKYEAVLHNTYNKENKAGFLKKLKYNNSIMRSAEFQDSFKNMSSKINYFYKLAYKTKNYFFVQCCDVLIDFAYRFKNRMHSFLCKNK